MSDAKVVYFEVQFLERTNMFTNLILNKPHQFREKKAYHLRITSHIIFSIYTCLLIKMNKHLRNKHLLGYQKLIFQYRLNNTRNLKTVAHKDDTLGNNTQQVNISLLAKIVR